MLSKEQHNQKVQKLLKNRGYDVRTDGEWDSLCEDAWQDLTYNKISMAGVGHRETNRFLPQIMREYDAISLSEAEVTETTKTTRAEKTSTEPKEDDNKEYPALQDQPTSSTEEENKSVTQSTQEDEPEVESFNITKKDQEGQSTQENDDFLSTQRKKKKKKK